MEEVLVGVAVAADGVQELVPIHLEDVGDLGCLVVVVRVHPKHYLVFTEEGALVELTQVVVVVVKLSNATFSNQEELFEFFVRRHYYPTLGQDLTFD